MITRDTKERMGDATQSLKEDLRELRHATGDAARETAGELRAAMTDAVTRGRERAHRAADGARDHVRAHPLRWVAISAAVGALAGYVLQARRNRARVRDGD